MKNPIFRKIIIIILSGVFIILIMKTLYNFFIQDKKVKPNVEEYSILGKESLPILQQKRIDLENIIKKNEEEILTEKIEKTETDVEFNTQYRENNSLAKGKIQTIQEGQDGKQNAIVKKIYKNGEMIAQNLISSDITKTSIDKIVEVGTAAFSNNYTPIKDDVLRVTAITMAIRVDPKTTSEKIITVNANENVVLQDKKDNWYYVKYKSYFGWAEKDSMEYFDPNNNGSGDGSNPQYSKEQLTSGFGFSMLLNKRSGLTLEQFRKIFANDKNDKNNIFKENADYFYYVEKQYNINGVFVAAVAIHESGWGSSAISKNKKNLFGYGAYDRDPYGMSYNFENYSSGIDLVSRVFVKYYLNPKGTPIYSGETAQGTYFKGATLTGVNMSYASDKNWANSVYKWMMYLYNKL